MSDPLTATSAISAVKQLRPLCLASTSPRRRELLERFGLHLALFNPAVDERYRPGESPEGHVARLAAEKAAAAGAGQPGHGILAGDTVVVHGGLVLGKPRNPEHAAEMLHSLSGMAHRVITAYALLDADTGVLRARTVETRVVFRTLSPEWIRWYSAQPETRDKAGAYGIQGLGGAMVDRIEGSYTNVVGFPIEAIFWDLLELGWVSF